MSTQSCAHLIWHLAENLNYGKSLGKKTIREVTVVATVWFPCTNNPKIRRGIFIFITNWMNDHTVNEINRKPCELWFVCFLFTQDSKTRNLFPLIWELVWVCLLGFWNTEIQYKGGRGFLIPDVTPWWKHLTSFLDFVSSFLSKGMPSSCTDHPQSPTKRTLPWPGTQ